jgi:hypothetical protein
MNPENESRAWGRLQARAASCLPPDFADRVLRAARAGIEAAPSVLGQFLLGAATAALCAVVVVVFHSRATHAETARNLADWQAISSSLSVDDLSQTQ